MKLTAVKFWKRSFTYLKMYRRNPSVGTHLSKTRPAYDFALEHFDFFYGPIYGKRWPSIRLGLLCEQKVCALINGYVDSDATIESLTNLGAEDLLALVGQSKIRSDRPRNLTKDKISSDVQKPEREVGDETFDDSKDQTTDFVDEDTSRGAESLMEFVQPTKKLEMSKVDKRFVEKDIETDQPHYRPVDVEFVDDDSFNVPEALRVLTFPRRSVETFPPSESNYDRVYYYYLLDASTIFSIIALDLKVNDRVLDMCSAPGGAALTMIQTLLPGRLVCNDVSQSRLNQARFTLNKFLPQSALIRDRITMSQKDPSSEKEEWRDFDKYDKVLVNVPSTNDRYSLYNTDDKEDNLFRPALNAERLQLPERQGHILKAGLMSLRNGGTLIYTTNSLSPIQNDAVVENVLREIIEEGQIDVVVCNLKTLTNAFDDAGIFKFYDGCRFGRLILPFLPSNFGPMYISKLKRVR